MSHARNILFGVSIADALGVPVEFKSRELIAKDPVTGMREFGTYNQVKGTWSDDSSLTFCLAESMVEGYDLERVGKKFESWLYDNHWTAHGNVFDIGNSTRFAIDRIAQGYPAEGAGRSDESSQGNGSLMRILPLVFHIMDMDPFERWDQTMRCSSITHGHINCGIACFIYLEMARNLIMQPMGSDPYVNFMSAYKLACDQVRSVIPLDHLTPFLSVLNEDVLDRKEDSIQSSGFVIHTLESSLWCIRNSSSYEEAVLKAVNLGDDTDTTAAVTGGLAAILYGAHSIPKKWMDVLARKDDIEELATRLTNKYPSWES